MRVLLQRVSHAEVRVEGAGVVGAVENGFLALVGIGHADTDATVDRMVHKTVGLRVFEDDAGKMNLSLLDVGGGVLVVSQFTLYADMRKGRRPSFIDAALSDAAAPLVERYAHGLRAAGVAQVSTGRFGALMHVTLTNIGPVTLWLDSADFEPRAGP